MAEEETGEEVAENAPPEPRVGPAAEGKPADVNALDLQELGEAPEPAETSEKPSQELQMREIPDPPRSAQDLEPVYEIPIKVSAVLGKTPMHVSQLLKMGIGAVIELDRKVGEAIDIYINNRLVARGEVVVVDDRLGVTMTEIIKTDRT